MAVFEHADLNSLAHKRNGDGYRPGLVASELVRQALLVEEIQ